MDDFLRYAASGLLSGGQLDFISYPTARDYNTTAGFVN